MFFGYLWEGMRISNATLRCNISGKRVISKLCAHREVNFDTIDKGTLSTIYFFYWKNYCFFQKF